MTIVRTEHKTCAVCDVSSPVRVWLSYSSFEKMGPSLDGCQPGAPNADLVQFCRHCGYASYEITEVPQCPGIIKTKFYRDVLKHRWIDDSCKGYLCLTFFLVADDDYKGAFWSSLRAAWVCDADDYWQGSEEYRLQALEMMRRSHEAGIAVSESQEQDHLLQTDLLRRTGSFQQAMSIVMEALKGCREQKMGRLLRFERRLIENGDKAVHWVKEAEGVAWA